MASYPTKLAEAFAKKVITIFYARSVADAITNNDYEGEVKDKASIVNILTFGALDAQNYDGSNLTVDDLTEVNGQLLTNQAKSFYFRVKSWDQFRSFIKNPANTILTQTANRLKQIIDQYVLGLHGDVAAGHRIGTDYTTGTVTVAATTGVVTGSATTFTSAMVGKPFKADGHTVWYRVKTYNSSTEIVIEDDKDDETSAYTGGAISGGSTYTIQAATAIQVTKDNIYAKIVSMRSLLTNSEIPEEDRWLVVPTDVAALIRQSPEYVAIGSESGRNGVMNGYVTKMAGFEIFEVSDTRIGGNSVDGWHIMGGHKSAITFAMGMTENGTEDLIGNFGKAYKNLFVYGAKVLDERRKALTELYAKL